MTDRDPTQTANEILNLLNGYNLIEAQGILSVIQFEMYLITAGVPTEMSAMLHESKETH